MDRERREALLDAVNAHDIEAIKSFVDPSYVGKDESGRVAMNYQQAMDAIAWMFGKHPEYRETVEVEEIRVEGDTAKVTTRRTEAYKGMLGSERNREARQVETWMQREGRWVLVEEQLIQGSTGDGGTVPWWSWT